MKFILTLVLLSLHFSGALFGKEYILDKKNYMQPAGTVIEEQMLMTIRDGKMSVVSNARVMNGVTSSVMSEAVETTIINTNKYRSLMKINHKTGSTVIEGQEMPNDIEEEPLLNVLIIFEKKEGKWTAAPEKGKLNILQKKELAELVEKENKEATMYGYKARKVGDVWGVGLPALKILLGADELTKGKATVTFKGIEKFENMECAALVVTFDVEGKEKEVDVKMKGTANVTRSLEFLLDVKVSGEMDMDMRGDVQPGVKMQVKAKAVINQEASIKVPVIDK